jgi:release factor glutamine methyltransferase
MAVREMLQEAERLAREGEAGATAWDARLLLAHATGRRNPLNLDPAEELTAETGFRFRLLWCCRLSGEPVQHLIGEWDFYGRPFAVDDRALVPRPETELLVATALREAPHARTLLDAGTGSGVVAATFLAERPEAQAVALDGSLAALALARRNQRRHGLQGRLYLVASDWLSALIPGPFDCAVSNPPYLPLSARDGLPRTVREHDPSSALYAGEDGLAAIRHLLQALPPYLAPGSPFLFEIGHGQARAVEQEIRKHPAWAFVAIEPDLAGIPRVAIARRGPDTLSSGRDRPDR